MSNFARAFSNQDIFCTMIFLIVMRLTSHFVIIANFPLLTAFLQLKQWTYFIQIKWIFAF